MPPGFNREELKPRYDVRAMREDEWHTYSGAETASLLAQQLANAKLTPAWLLNAGAGVYDVGVGAWDEISVDLFPSPIAGRQRPVCTSIEKLPFGAETIGGVVCVGEVLAYCDPAVAISEFARVLAPAGLLICDFGSSLSFRHWFRQSFGRAADLVTDHYNGSPERTWVYNPSYISSLLKAYGFTIRKTLGTHTWSAFARRLGVPIKISLMLQKKLSWISLPNACADVTTVVAVRASI